MEHRHRLRVKVGLAEGDATMPTVTPMFPTANWHEREVYDFFGVTFDGHPDLTRILLPDGWEGHPLLQDRGARRREHPLPRRVHPAGRHTNHDVTRMQDTPRHAAQLEYRSAGLVSPTSEPSCARRR